MERAKMSRRGDRGRVATGFRAGGPIDAAAAMSCPEKRH